mmetsp:Transcript_91473/g.181835  ORF Transcript_91473/g.181835 Transcript_91473/m.181835 type:complete len:101 (+) Transcript_91473:246-548(+)
MVHAKLMLMLGTFLHGRGCQQGKAGISDYGIRSRYQGEHSRCSIQKGAGAVIFQSRAQCNVDCAIFSGNSGWAYFSILTCHNPLSQGTCSQLARSLFHFS